MKKLFYLFLIFFPVLMPCGCSDIDDSSLAEYGNNTYIVTDAEVCRYAYGTSTEFEVMLFLDGCSLDSPYGSMVYFGLEFPYSLTGLPEGSFSLGYMDALSRAYIYFWPGEDGTDWTPCQMVSGLLTIRKTDDAYDEYSLSFTGVDVYGERLECRYTGPVQFVDLDSMM